jgi:2-hydroxychromene-2-carboxylate isomerase
MAGSSTAEQPRFYYDLASPEAYLAAERVLHAFDEVPEWIPVLIGEPGGTYRCVHEVDAYREDVARRAARLGVMPIRWPDPFPAADITWAMLAATYAKSVGRGVAFSLAAFRQAFAAGRDLGERDNVLVAGAACEMHPTALIKGAGLRGTADKLAAASARAVAEGVTALPAVVVAGRVVEGERAIPVPG